MRSDRDPAVQMKGLNVGEFWKCGNQAVVTLLGFAVVKKVNGPNGATEKVVLLVTPKGSKQWMEQDEFIERYKWVPKGARL